MEVERHLLPDGSTIVTGITSLCQQELHAACPGREWSEEYGGETVFCICPCHALPAES